MNPTYNKEISDYVTLKPRLLGVGEKEKIEKDKPQTHPGV